MANKQTFGYTPVFSTGEWKGRNWTESDLDAIIAATKSGGNKKVPFTLGHPQSDKPPSFGHFMSDTLTKHKVGKDVLLLVKPEEFDDGFLDKVRGVNFDKVSIGMSNKLALKHVGFTDNPAVKNLPAFGTVQYQFSDDDLLVDVTLPISYSFADRRMPYLGNMVQRMRDKWIERYGVKEADELFDQYTIDELKVYQPEIPAEIQQKIDALVAGATQQTQPTSTEFENKLSPEILELQNKVAGLNKRNTELEFEKVLDSPEVKLRLPQSLHAEVRDLLLDAVSGDGYVFDADATGTAQRIIGFIKKLPQLTMMGEVVKTEDGLTFEEKTQDLSAKVKQVMDEAEANGRSISASEAIQIVRTRQKSA